jgi:hypothetical protein
MPFDPVRISLRSEQLGGGDLVQRGELLLDRRADGAIALLDQIAEYVIGVLGDIGGQRLFVECRDVMSGEVRQKTIERPVLGIGRAQFEGFISEGFVGPKAGVLAVQPVAKISQGSSSFSEQEEASAYSTSPRILQDFGFFQKCERTGFPRPS